MSCQNGSPGTRGLRALSTAGYVPTRYGGMFEVRVVVLPGSPCQLLRHKILGWQRLTAEHAPNVGKCMASDRGHVVKRRSGNMRREDEARRSHPWKRMCCRQRFGAEH